MEFLYNVLVPIIASILGGFVAGCFTFLGVKLTILNNNKIKKQEIRENNILKNKKIISKRPQFEIVQNKTKTKHNLDVYILPYINPKLKNDHLIWFDYDNLNLDDDYWKVKKLTLQNNGKKIIERGFIQLGYKSYTNIYSRSELESWNSSWIKNYYSDHLSLPNYIQPNECVKINIFFYKNLSYNQNVIFDCYMVDEDNNYWFQEGINVEMDKKNKSVISTTNEYSMHYGEGYYEWFIYDHMYYNKDIKKEFKILNFDKELKNRKEKLWKLNDENNKLKNRISNGDILLNS